MEKRKVSVCVRVYVNMYVCRREKDLERVHPKDFVIEHGLGKGRKLDMEEEAADLRV